MIKHQLKQTILMSNI